MAYVKRSVETRFWESKAMNGLTSDHKYLLLYFLTCPGSNLTGVMRFSFEDCCLHTGLTPGKVGDLLPELLLPQSHDGEPFVEYETFTRTLWVVKRLEHELAPKTHILNPHVEMIQKIIGQLPPSPILERFCLRYQTFGDLFPALLAEIRGAKPEQATILPVLKRGAVRKLDIDTDRINLTPNEVIEKRVLDLLNELSGNLWKIRSFYGNSLRARIREGVTVEHLETVVRLKAAQWADKPDMQTYLRPSTLFGPHNFVRYLQEAQSNGKKPQGDGFVRDRQGNISGIAAAKWLRDEAQRLHNDQQRSPEYDVELSPDESEVYAA